MTSTNNPARRLNFVEEVPHSNSGFVRTRDKYKWYYEALRANPGKWAQHPSKYHSVAYDYARRNPEFEAVARGSGNDQRGWMRYVGAETDTFEPTPPAEYIDSDDSPVVGVELLGWRYCEYMGVLPEHHSHFKATCQKKHYRVARGDRL